MALSPLPLHCSPAPCCAPATVRLQAALIWGASRQVLGCVSVHAVHASQEKPF